MKCVLTLLRCRLTTTIITTAVNMRMFNVLLYFAAAINQPNSTQGEFYTTRGMLCTSPCRTYGESYTWWVGLNRVSIEKQVRTGQLSRCVPTKQRLDGQLMRHDDFRCKTEKGFDSTWDGADYCSLRPNTTAYFEPCTGPCEKKAAQYAFCLKEPASAYDVNWRYVYVLNWHKCFPHDDS